MDDGGKVGLERELGWRGEVGELIDDCEDVGE